MNNLIEGLQKINQYFLYRRRWFSNFLHVQCLEKYLLSCLLLWKQLLILDILLEAASESPPPPKRDWPGGNSKGIMNLNSAFENAESQSTCCEK